MPVRALRLLLIPALLLVACSDDGSPVVEDAGTTVPTGAFGEVRKRFFGCASLVPFGIVLVRPRRYRSRYGP